MAQEEILDLKGRVKLLEMKMEALIKALAREGVVLQEDVELELKESLENES